MFKTVRFFQIVAVVLALALAAAPVFADAYKRSLTLNEPAKLGGIELKPGDYTIQFDGSKVTVKQGNKVLAEAAAEWVETDWKAPGNTVVIDDGTIAEFRIEGKKRVIKVKL